MFDPLSLILAAMLTLQAGTTDPSYNETRAVIIDTGSPSTQPPPPAEDSARSQIIDTGNS